MTRPRTAALWLLATTLLAQPLCGEAGVAGRWEGSLTFRQSVWPIGMEFTQSDGSLSATLDLPDMVMIERPLPLIREESPVRVQLPFGIGEFDLTPTQNEIRSSRAIGDEAMLLELKRAADPPYRREPFVIESDGAHLTGTLWLPHGETPRPAIVLVHGSGVGDRTHVEYRSWADFYARRGIATLIYDRRGQGESTGSREDDRHFKQLAADAAAMVSYLSQRDEIDSARIGIAGSSQGGWIAPLAAVDNPLVSFMILSSTPAVSPAEQEIQAVVNKMRAADLDETSIQHALAYLRLYFYTAHHGEGWPELQQAMKRGQDQDWIEYVDQPQRLEQLHWWSNHHDFDPVAVLSRIDIPVLAFYGERDNSVPFTRNEALLRSYLEQGGADLIVKRLARADHRNETPMGRDDEGRWHWPRISLERFEATEAWSVDRVLNR